MYSHNKRHSCGGIMPNLFFVLQCMAIGLLAYMFTQLASMMQLPGIFTYVMVIMVIGTVYYCLEKREIVMHRERWVC